MPEFAFLIGLGVWSMFVIVYLLVRLPAGATLTGADGPFPTDQLQYFAWMRDSGAHILAGDLFELPAGARVFVHPMWLISGLLWRAGVPIAVAGLIWKPVAVVVLALGVRAYVARLVPGGAWVRCAVMAVAIFYSSPAVHFYQPAGGLSSEMFTAGQLWGYLPMVLAVALTPIYLLALERAVHGEPGKRWRACAMTAAAALLAGWLHPWQGEVAAVITVGLLVGTRDRGTVRVLLLALGSAVLPLAGYFALSRLDPSWRLASSATMVPRQPLSILVAGVAPLAVLAAFGVSNPGHSFQERALLLWPPASLLAYFVLSPSFPRHALGGMAIPLAVLAARGAQRLLVRFRVPGAVIAVGIAAGLTIPGSFGVVRFTIQRIGIGDRGQMIRAPERAALRFLAGVPGDGGVLAPAQIAMEVPAFTGKPTWLGHHSWTPSYDSRRRLTAALAAGALTNKQAQQLVISTTSSYLVLGCASPPQADAALGPLTAHLHRFGCARVYTLPRGLR